MQMYKTKFINLAREPIYLGDIVRDTITGKESIAIFDGEEGEMLQDLRSKDKIKMNQDMCNTVETVERLEDGPLGG